LLDGIVEGGYEVSLHGYLHEQVSKCSTDQMRACLRKSYDLIKELTGKAPRGTCAPFNEITQEQIGLFEELGIEYDNSMSHSDCQPYWLRDGDSYTKIDYSKPAEEWMKPFKYGKRISSIVEIGNSWHNEDMLPMQPLLHIPNSNGWIDPRTVEYVWQERFKFYYETYDDFVFQLTIHPDTTGAPQVIRMVERFLKWTMEFQGVDWVEFQDINDYFRKNNPHPNLPKMD